MCEKVFILRQGNKNNRGVNVLIYNKIRNITVITQSILNLQQQKFCVFRFILVINNDDDQLKLN